MGEHELTPTPRRRRKHNLRGLLLAGCIGCFFVGLLSGYLYATGGKGLYSISGLGDGAVAIGVTPGRTAAPHGRKAGGAAHSRIRWPVHPFTGQACNDTCFKARDGVCDEGRHRTEPHPSAPDEPGLRVLCDLGTDCSDCGPWKGDVMKPWSTEHAGPVSFAHSMGAEIYVKRSRTRPDFLMAYTNPKVDLDISHLMHMNGMVEGGITQIFHAVLQGKCELPQGGKGLVVDVGSNFGYFTLYAAAMGCRVVAFEPVPLFRAFIRYNLALNGMSHLVALRSTVASNQAGLDLDFAVPTKGVWGTASVAGMNLHHTQEPTLIKVRTETLDDVVTEDVMLLKVDVEGHEPEVLQGARQLLAKRDVANVVLEYNPGVIEFSAANRVHGDSAKLRAALAANPEMLLALLDHGYRIGQMPDNVAKAGEIGYGRPMEGLPEVLRENLQFDLKDCELYAARQLGCPIQPELRQLNPLAWNFCNQLPDDAHPKSLRSMFPYNTNLWAAKSTQLLPVRGEVVGIFNAGEDTAHTWFVTKSFPMVALGAGGVGQRACKYLEPHMLVRSRCLCNWAPPTREDSGKDDPAYTAALERCKQEEEVARKLALQGKMPFRD